MDWTKEIKEKLVADYLAAKPTIETSSEIVSKLAEGIEGATVNGTRIILAKAKDAEGNKIYVSAVNKGTPATSDKPASKKVNKQDSLDALKNIIKDNKLEIDEDIINRMTGKAAIYFTGLLKEIAD